MSCAIGVLSVWSEQLSILSDDDRVRASRECTIKLFGADENFLVEVDRVR